MNMRVDRSFGDGENFSDFPAGLPRATHSNTSHSRAVREYGVLRAPRERLIKCMPGEVLFTGRRVI